MEYNMAAEATTKLSEVASLKEIQIMGGMDEWPSVDGLTSLQNLNSKVLDNSYRTLDHCLVLCNILEEVKQSIELKLSDQNNKVTDKTKTNVVGDGASEGHQYSNLGMLMSNWSKDLNDIDKVIVELATVVSMVCPEKRGEAAARRVERLKSDLHIMGSMIKASAAVIRHNRGRNPAECAFTKHLSGLVQSSSMTLQDTPSRSARFANSNNSTSSDRLRGISSMSVLSERLRNSLSGNKLAKSQRSGKAPPPWNDNVSMMSKPQPKPAANPYTQNIQLVKLADHFLNAGMKNRKKKGGAESAESIVNPVMLMYDDGSTMPPMVEGSSGDSSARPRGDVRDRPAAMPRKGGQPVRVMTNAGERMPETTPVKTAILGNGRKIKYTISTRKTAAAEPAMTEDDTDDAKTAAETEHLPEIEEEQASSEAEIIRMAEKKSNSYRKTSFRGLAGLKKCDKLVG